MAGNIIMLEIQFPAIIMRHPYQTQKVSIYNEIKANNCQAMLHNGARLNFNRTDPEGSSSSELFCDKQRFHDWMGQRGCGCYRMNKRRSDLVVEHTVSFVSNNIKSR